MQNKLDIKRLANKCLFVIYIVLSVDVFAQQDKALSQVEIDSVIAASLSATTDLIGTIQSRAHIKITASVDGRLEWLAESGTSVRKGDVLAKMDLLPLRLKLEEHVAEIKRAKINAKYLKNESNRLDALIKNSVVSLRQLDQARTEYELAEAELEIFQSRKKQIEDQIDRAVLRSPFDGLITERLVRERTDVNRGELLLKLLDTQHLEVCVFVPIKSLPFISEGAELQIGEGEYKIKAPVATKIPSVDPRSQTFELRLTVPEQYNTRWSSGQILKVAIPVQSTLPSLTIHRDALILRKDGTYVMKIDSQNKVRKLPIIVGQGSFDRVSVSGALTSGDRVAIRGAEELSEGQEVIVR